MTDALSAVDVATGEFEGGFGGLVGLDGLVGLAGLGGLVGLGSGAGVVGVAADEAVGVVVSVKVRGGGDGAAEGDVVEEDFWGVEVWKRRRCGWYGWW